jgi:hypothetical protein
MHPFAIDAKGNLFVSIGSATRRKAVAAIADFLHPLGYRTASGTASPKRRDNAADTVEKFEDWGSLW